MNKENKRQFKLNPEKIEGLINEAIPYIHNPEKELPILSSAILEVAGLLCETWNKSKDISDKSGGRITLGVSVVVDRTGKDVKVETHVGFSEKYRYDSVTYIKDPSQLNMEFDKAPKQDPLQLNDSDRDETVQEMQADIAEMEDVTEEVAEMNQMSRDMDEVQMREPEEQEA